MKVKEIGESFRIARCNIGLSKEEVVKDLNITLGQLDNLEDGNANAFKDIFFLKDLVKKYAIYLNLDSEEIISKFNDFIFGYTSRIPVEDILEQTREFNLLEKKNNEDKVVSPYTKVKKEYKTKYILLCTLGVIILIVIVFLLIVYIANKTNNKLLSDNLERNVYHECAQ